MRRRRPCPRFRWLLAVEGGGGRVIAGIAVGLVGLVCVVGGGVVGLVTATQSSIDPLAEARTPGTARFVAEDAKYDVSLVRVRTDSARTAASFTCEVALADGTTKTIDGSIQAIGPTTANIESIGSFDAVAGATSVFCEADGGDNRFIVDKQSAWKRVGTVVLAVGIPILLAGAGLILAGIFWRKPAQAADPS